MTRETFFRVLAVLSLQTGAVSASAQQVLRLPAADAALAARPRAVFAVGKEDGREWEVFANVGDIAFDSKENLYVLDRGNSRVVAFDSAGRFLRIFGREGAGPGEFTAAQRMTITRNDEVVVSDVARGAFSVFGTDGVFRRSVPFAQGALMKGEKLVPHPRGGVVSYFLPSPGSASRVGRVLWQPLGGGSAAPLLAARADASPRPRVFAPTTRYSVLPEGSLAVASTEGYSVRILPPNGGAPRVLERAIRPRPVTARDRQQEQERRAAFSRPGGITIMGSGAGALPASVRAQAAREFQDVEFADVMPVIEALETDAAGNLWIQRAAQATGGSGPIDIVTPQGRYVGTLTGLRLPGAFSARGRIAYVETSELGTPRVVVMRLPARWR